MIFAFDFIYTFAIENQQCEKIINYTLYIIRYGYLKKSVLRFP